MPQPEWEWDSVLRTDPELRRLKEWALVCEAMTAYVETQQYKRECELGAMLWRCEDDR